jgi:predicted outer membrane repeat protein
MSLAIDASRALASTLALLAVVGSTAAAQSTWHVRYGAAPGGDGLSWPSAFAGLDDGLAAAQPGDQVWVAAGTYLPTQLSLPTEPRSAVFELPDLVDVYGGFSGHETSLAQRAGLFWETVLSGDIGVPGDPSDNAFHVTRFASDFSYHATARLDGFRITQGRSDGVQRGAGLHVTANFGINSWCVLDLANCHVVDNLAYRGGGIAVDNLSFLRMERCSVEGNTALADGGGLFCLAGRVWCHNAYFRQNTAVEDGGAIFTHSNATDWMQFANALFHDNGARRGGAIFLGSAPFYIGRIHLRSSTLAYNRALQGGGVFAEGQSFLKVSNAILWANRAEQDAQVFPPLPSVDKTIEFCTVEGGYPGSGNLLSDPLFVDPDGRNLRTLAGSPAHDSANLSLFAKDFFDLDGDGNLEEQLPMDLDDLRRRMDDPRVPDLPAGGWPAPDRGAYEYGPGS